MQLPKAKTTVPPSGSVLSKCVLVLSAPDRVDITRRAYLSSKEGYDFLQMLAQQGIFRNDIYVTAAIKDYDDPINTHISHSPRAGVSTSHRFSEYRAFLIEELQQFAPRVIIAAGNAALYALTGLYGIHKWRGSILKNERGQYIVPVIEPWNLRTDNKAQFLIEQDLRKATDIYNKIYTPTVRNVKIYPTFKEVIDFANHCYHEGRKGSRISFDIEVNNYNEQAQAQGLVPQVTHISLAIGLDSICIPFVEMLGDYFPAEQELDIWKMLALILEDASIEKIGQNLIFDSQFLYRTYGIRSNNLHDTMIAQQTLLHEYPKGLDMITSLWTDQQYYKDDGKEFLTGGSDYEKFCRYNAIDSLMCSEAFPKMEVQLRATGNWETYERQRKLIPVLTCMMERGVKVDVAGMHNEFLEVGRKIEELEAELEDMCGKGFNPRSTKDVHHYFYEIKHQKPYKKRNTAGIMAPCYDETAMKRLIRKGFKEAKLIQEVKRLGKMRAMYLDITKVDKDGRYRCAYNPSGTSFSRLSSSENIFGTGGNLQNWVKDLRRYLLIDEGYVGYSIDLSQAENRIVAYQGRVLPMIRAFENGDDVHSLTARLIMNVILGEQKAAEMDVRSKSFLGDQTHTWRDWGKKANHGFNYDWGYKAFALKNEMSEKDGKLVYDSYHTIYPEIQGRFHRDIRDALKSTRTITNLMGRKTLFMSVLDDNVYRAAYSCIPQGTVGDIINEYGLEYIYYDQHNFGKVELLTQTHDEIIFQIPLNEECTFEDHAIILEKIISSLEPELTTSHGMKFVIPADLTMIYSLNTKDAIKEGGCGLSVDHRSCYDTKQFALKLEETWRTLDECRKAKAEN